MKFDIEKYLRERARKKTRISITLDEEYHRELLQLAKLHKVPLSSIIEACIGLGLADPYISGNKKEEANKK